MGVKAKNKIKLTAIEAANIDEKTKIASLRLG